MAIHQIVPIKFIQDSICSFVAFQHASHRTDHVGVVVMLFVVRCKEGHSESFRVKDANDLSNQCLNGSLVTAVCMRLLDGYIRFERCVRACWLRCDVDSKIAIVLETIAGIAAWLKKERIDLRIRVKLADSGNPVHPFASDSTWLGSLRVVIEMLLHGFGVQARHEDFHGLVWMGVAPVAKRGRIID